jgi:hypothetical protein
VVVLASWPVWLVLIAVLLWVFPDGRLAQPAVAVGVLASLLVWLAVQVPRYRRSAGERRQQFKWLYTGATIFVVSVISAVLVSGGSSGLDLAVTARMRQTVDLDTVQGDLVGVVDEALEPAHVSVWLAGTRQQAPVLPGLRHPDLSRAGSGHRRKVIRARTACAAHASIGPGTQQPRWHCCPLEPPCSPGA